MKIAVIADIHANLPALEAALSAIDTEGCDSIFHLGDAIAIGPYPAECVDLLQNRSNLKCVSGNHDSYFVNGLPKPQPKWMSDGEVQHQLWTHRQLGKHRKLIVSQWPMILEEVIDGSKTVFLHYGLTSSRKDFIGIVHNPSSRDMDQMFGDQESKFVFFGHDHTPSDIQGKARYINPGSLGCCLRAEARYTIAKYEGGLIDIKQCSVAYEDEELFETFEKREVPEREFIYKAFFGGRFRT